MWCEWRGSLEGGSVAWPAPSGGDTSTRGTGASVMALKPPWPAKPTWAHAADIANTPLSRCSILIGIEPSHDLSKRRANAPQRTELRRLLCDQKAVQAVAL